MDNVETEGEFALPEKRYFTLGEVSQICDVKPHVLRYWEREFPQLKPYKRRGDKRYYLNEDILVVRQIRRLLFELGYTVGAVKQQLATWEKEGRAVQDWHAPSARPAIGNKDFKQIIEELKQVLEELS